MPRLRAGSTRTLPLRRPREPPAPRPCGLPRRGRQGNHQSATRDLRADRDGGAHEAQHESASRPGHRPARRPERRREHHGSEQDVVLLDAAPQDRDRHGQHEERRSERMPEPPSPPSLRHRGAHHAELHVRERAHEPGEPVTARERHGVGQEHLVVGRERPEPIVGAVERRVPVCPHDIERLRQVVRERVGGPREDDRAAHDDVADPPEHGGAHQSSERVGRGRGRRAPRPCGPRTTHGRGDEEHRDHEERGPREDVREGERPARANRDGEGKGPDARRALPGSQLRVLGGPEAPRERSRHGQRRAHQDEHREAQEPPWANGTTYTPR